MDFVTLLCSSLRSLDTFDIHKQMRKRHSLARSLNMTVIARSRSPHELARARTHTCLLACSRALCLSPACKEKPASNYCANLKDTCIHKDNKVCAQTRGRASLGRTRETTWTILYRGAHCAFRILSVYFRTIYDACVRTCRRRFCDSKTSQETKM